MLPTLFNRRHQNDLWPTFYSVGHWPSRLERAVDEALGATQPMSFPVNVRQEGDEWVVEADVPGLTREQVEITVEGGTLSISASYDEEQNDEKRQYHLRERRTGRFERSFTLPATADGEHVSAELKDGVLTVRIPTREEAKPRRIAVT